MENIETNFEFRTQYNYEPEIPVQSELPSETIPDMSQSIREIITKYVQNGIPPSGNTHLTYTGDTFAPDVRKMDFVELDKYKQKIRDTISELEDSYKELQKTMSEQAGPLASNATQGGGGGTTTTTSGASEAQGRASDDNLGSQINDYINYLTQLKNAKSNS